MRIVSYNVNGIRAAIRKGWLEWLATQPAEVVCVQETKATPADIDMDAIAAAGYHYCWFPAQKKGYSGVAIFSKIAPDAVVEGTGHAQSDAEGRVIRADFGSLTLINAYFPSGTSGQERQDYKYVWLNEFHDHIQALRQSRRQLVVVGDYNIAHTEADIHDPKGNKHSSGFLPEERAWMDQWVAAGMVDSLRVLHPEAKGAYSWWSQRFPSVREQNKGWRIDYICTTHNLKDAIAEAAVWQEVKHSDHCPVMARLAL